MKFFLLILLYLPIFPGDLEIGSKGNINSLMTNDFFPRRRMERYDFFTLKEQEMSFDNFTPSLFLRYFDDRGKYSVYSSLNMIQNYAYKYKRNDDLLMLDIFSAAGSSSGNTALASLAESKSTLNINRLDFFADGAYFFIPRILGLGAGYRSIENKVQSDDFSWYRISSKSERRTYTSDGLQFSVYWNSFFGRKRSAELSVRASYFSLEGPFSSSFTSFYTTAVSSGGSNPTYSYYPVIGKSFDSGSASVLRRGGELDIMMNFRVSKANDRVHVFTGFTYQESSVKVTNYSAVPFEITSAPRFNAVTTYTANLIYSRLVDTPAFSSPAAEKLFSIYFGVKMRFHTGKQPDPDPDY